MNTPTKRTKSTQLAGFIARLTPRRVSKLAVAVVAAVAAVVSYAHMQQLAAEAGEGWRSHLLPLSVDGLLIAAAMSMVVARLHGRDPSKLAWLALTLGVVASLAANVAAADPTWVGRLVAAWSPLALALSFELLMQQLRRTPTGKTVGDTAGSDVARPEASTEQQDGAPTSSPASTARPAPKRATPAKPTRHGRSARNGRGGRGGGGQDAARVVFKRAVDAGRAEAMTGAELAAKVGASPGAARKWLAAFRAERQQTTSATAAETSPADAETGASSDQHADRAGADVPRLAVVGEAYSAHRGGDA